MLHGIDPLIPPDLLHVLAQMGHGDMIALVDANFPATSNAKRLLTISGADTTRLLRAVLTLLPIDDFIPDPLITMQVVGDADAVPEAVRQYDALLRPLATQAIPREAFYQRARDAFAIVQTADARLYANIILTKGVIRG
jgi:L-fucose mutarotase